MSYILDALRKSEQQRQATQPDNVTYRILTTPPQSKLTSSKWIILLISTNLLLASYFFWYFSQTKTTQPKLDAQVEAKQQNQLNQPVTEKHPPSAESTALNPIGQSTERISPDLAQTESSLPSLSQWVEAKKMAANQRPIAKPIAEKKPEVVKKEPPPRPIETQKNQLEFPESIADEPTFAPKPDKKGISDLNDLPYEIRNQLPSLAINVFSYAYAPEDRFVIIDMVKYKTGHLIKGIVKLREIRPDSIVLEYGNNTFRVERP